MRRLGFFPVLAAGAMFPPALANGAATVCPASSMQFFYCSGLTHAAQYDSTCGAPGFSGTVRVHFDLAQKTLGMDATTIPLSSPSGLIRVADIYRLVGGTPGTPVTFSIRMPVTAAFHVPAFEDNSQATAGASLEVDGVVVAQASESYACSFGNCTTTGSLSAPLLVQVTIPQGQDFVLVAGLTASAKVSGGGGYARPEASFQFEGLPPGTSVVSCHDGLTPADRSTWGNLKLRYR